MAQGPEIRAEKQQECFNQSYVQDINHVTSYLWPRGWTRTHTHTHSHTNTHAHTHILTRMKVISKNLVYAASVRLVYKECYIFHYVARWKIKHYVEYIALLWKLFVVEISRDENSSQLISSQVHCLSIKASS